MNYRKKVKYIVLYTYNIYLNKTKISSNKKLKLK